MAQNELKGFKKIVVEGPGSIEHKTSGFAIDLEFGDLKDSSGTIALALGNRTLRTTTGAAVLSFASGLVASAELDLSSNKIVNVAAGTVATDATNLGQVEQVVADAIAAIPGTDLSNYYIKSEVDGLVSGAITTAGGYTDAEINDLQSLLETRISEVESDVAAAGAQITAVENGLSSETLARIDADALLIPLTQKGAANGVAELGADGKIVLAQLPALVITDTFVVASEAAMLAISGAEKGDVAVRTDLSKTFILAGNDASVLASWQELLTPTIQNTDQLVEGSTNLYFTAARAKTAAVVNTTAGTETDQAASVASMKTYVAAQIAAIPGTDLSNYYTKTEVNSALGALETDLEGQISNAITTANTYTDNAISGLSTTYYNKSEVDGFVLQLGSDISAGNTATLASANGYTDAEIVSMSGTLNTNMQNGDAATLASANTYTDTAIGNIPAVDLSQVLHKDGSVALNYNTYLKARNAANTSDDNLFRYGSYGLELGVSAFAPAVTNGTTLGHPDRKFLAANITTLNGVDSINGIGSGAVYFGNNLNLSTKQIKDLANGTAATDAVNKGQMDAADTATLNSANTYADLGDLAGGWKKFTVGYEQLQTAALTNNGIVVTLPARAVVEAVFMKHDTAFTGGSISAVTLSLGITGDMNKYASAFDILQAPAATKYQLSSQLAAATNWGTTEDVRFFATATGANLSALTAGTLTVSIKYHVLPA